jgi:hypothetical protein
MPETLVLSAIAHGRAREAAVSCPSATGSPSCSPPPTSSVSRAGAGTLAELIRCEVPAILVPYPHAASDHQRANAAFFERQGGGLVVEEAALGGLHAEVLDLIFNDWLLRQFRGNLRRMDRANSLELMLGDLEEWRAAPSMCWVPPRRRRPPHETFAAAPTVRPRRCAGSTAWAWAAWASPRWRSTWRARAGRCRARTTRSPARSRGSSRRRASAVGPLPAECDLVVRSSAIAGSHPSFLAAAGRGLACVRRGELLAEVGAGQCKLVAVCGSHGKTTTTAMLVAALRHAGFPAGYVAGGLFNDSTPPAATGSNEWVVAEVDESDGTIDGFAPEITVLVNLDWDHRTATGARASSRPPSPRSARAPGAPSSSATHAPARFGSCPSAATFGRSGSFTGTLVRREGGP